MTNYWGLCTLDEVMDAHVRNLGLETLHEGEWVPVAEASSATLLAALNDGVKFRVPQH